MKQIIFLIALIFLNGSCTPKTQEVSSNHVFTQAQGQIQNLNALEFKSKIETSNGTILDVRTQGEVAQGYIPQAIILDMYRSDFVDQLKLLPRDRPVFVYCASGVRSIQTSKILQKNGFKEIYNLHPGIIDWYRNGLPVTR